MSTKLISAESFEVTITAVALNFFMFFLNVVSQVFLASKVLSTDLTVKPGLILGMFGFDVLRKRAGVLSFKITLSTLLCLVSVYRHVPFQTSLAHCLVVTLSAIEEEFDSVFRLHM